MVEGPPTFNAAGQQVAAGWLNVTGAGFAEKVGTTTALAALREAGRLVGIAESHDIFLRDMELIWGVGAANDSGAPALYVLDFDKARVGIDSLEMEELRKNDPVFPKQGSRDIWGKAFYEGWGDGLKGAQLPVCTERHGNKMFERKGCKVSLAALSLLAHQSSLRKLGGSWLIANFHKFSTFSILGQLRDSVSDEKPDKANTTCV